MRIEGSEQSDNKTTNESSKNEGGKSDAFVLMTDLLLNHTGSCRVRRVRAAVALRSHDRTCAQQTGIGAIQTTHSISSVVYSPATASVMAAHPIVREHSVRFAPRK